MRPLQTCREFAFSPIIPCRFAAIAIIRVGLLRLSDISPSSGARARHLPLKGKAFAAGWGHPALRGNKNTPRGRGGVCPARGFTAITTLRANCPKGFPLWGKLSPKVTDEGATTGHFPLIRRVPRHLSPPQGEGFCCPVGAAYMPPVAAARILRYIGEIARDATMRPLQTCRKQAFSSIITYLPVACRERS